MRTTAQILGVTHDDCAILQCFFLGTFAPFLRASESPIAIACLRLLTVPPLPPLPDFKVPFLRRRIALSTLLPAPLLYFRPPDLDREVFFAGKAVESGVG